MFKNASIEKLFRNDIKKLGKIIACDAKEHERKWSLIKRSYNRIFVYRLNVGTIGEFVVRYLMIKEDLIDNESDLFVIVPYIADIRKEISNKNLLDLIGQEICIINHSNYEFWRYVIKRHYNDLDFTCYEKYENRRDTYYEVYKDLPLINIGSIQKQICKKISRKIGISHEYVCFHSRDEQYNVKVLGKDFEQFIYRNSSFANYVECIEYLRQQHIQAVRMGKYVGDCINKTKIVDFAGKYYADFMDVFLISACKFYVGSNSGINMVAKAFAKPVLIVNSVYVTVGSACEVNMKENMLIPKKYYNKRSKKYLSLRAIARYEKLFADNTSQYAKKGIEIIENTPQEILDAVIEMNERLNGTWIETEEDRFLQQKYMDILNRLNEENRKRFWNGGGTMYRIGSKYLKENRYLIEE